MYDDYAELIPEDAEAARTEFNMHAEHLAQGNRNLEAEIEQLEDEMRRLERGEVGERGRSWVWGYLREEEGDGDGEGEGGGEGWW